MDFQKVGKPTIPNFILCPNIKVRKQQVRTTVFYSVYIMLSAYRNRLN